MLRDITIGQYYSADSVLHRMDPRTKLLGTLVYLVSLFLFDSLPVYALAAAFLLFVILLSRVPFSYMVKGLKPIMFFLVFTIVMNMFLVKGEVIWTFWKLQVTREGLRQSFFMAARLIMLILGSNLMTLTTTPTRLTNAMEAVMKPLRLIKVPVHEIAMMMSIALRFIPILMEEMQKIMNAQMARGASFDEGNIVKKAKSLVPILVPLFVSAFRRADDLAMAMEARCYHGGEGRTKMKPLRYQKRDWIAYVILVLYVAAVVVVGKVWYL